MPKISREESAKIEARVLEAVEASEGPVTSQVIAKKLGLNWQAAKVTLLELALLGKIDAELTTLGWKFAKKPSQTVHANNHRIAVPKNGNGVHARIEKVTPENVSNARIVEGLSKIYGNDRVQEILVQAQGSYYFRNPACQNTPEIYELFQNGDIDSGLEALGLHSWSIGRPKIGGF